MIYKQDMINSRRYPSLYTFVIAYTHIPTNKNQYTIDGNYPRTSPMALWRSHLHFYFKTTKKKKKKKKKWCIIYQWNLINFVNSIVNLTTSYSLIPWFRWL